MSGRFAVAPVTEEELSELLGLMRAYCDFYDAAPADADLLALSRALLADPDREGVQLLARDRDRRGAAAGFATVYWSWSTAQARRLAVMNDLFVTEDARGTMRSGPGLMTFMVQAPPARTPPTPTAPPRCDRTPAARGGCRAR